MASPSQQRIRAELFDSDAELTEAGKKLMDRAQRSLMYGINPDRLDQLRELTKSEAKELYEKMFVHATEPSQDVDSIIFIHEEDRPKQQSTSSMDPKLFISSVHAENAIKLVASLMQYLSTNIMLLRHKDNNREKIPMGVVMSLRTLYYAFDRIYMTLPPRRETNLEHRAEIIRTRYNFPGLISNMLAVRKQLTTAAITQVENLDLAIQVMNTAIDLISFHWAPKDPGMSEE